MHLDCHLSFPCSLESNFGCGCDLVTARAARLHRAQPGPPLSSTQVVRHQDSAAAPTPAHPKLEEQYSARPSATA